MPIKDAAAAPVVVKKVETPVQALKRHTASTEASTSLLKFKLPTEADEPSFSFKDLTWLIHGEKGIGKTSTAARFPGALIVPFEPGTKFLKVPRLPVVTMWEQFLHVVKQLQEGGHKYQTIIIDPGNKAYDCAMDYVCRMENIVHPSDRKDYGKTWLQVSKEFQNAHTALAYAGLSMVILAHSKTLELETVSGKVFDRVVPVMSGATEEYYAGVVDMIGYYHYFRKERYLQIRGDDYVMAKCRPEHNFLTPNGEPVVRIPMGRSSAEAYENIVKAFENRQTKTYSELGEEAPSTGHDDAPLSRHAYKSHDRKNKDRNYA